MIEWYTFKIWTNIDNAGDMVGTIGIVVIVGATQNEIEECVYLYVSEDSLSMAAALFVVSRDDTSHALAVMSWKILPFTRLKPKALFKYVFKLSEMYRYLCPY